MFDYIQGEKFRYLADNQKFYYCDTHDVNNFLKQFKSGSDFVLITHNSDGNVTDSPLRGFDADIRYMPQNLKRWYAQNVDVAHDKIESIPIGLENSQWFPETKKIEKLSKKRKEEKNIRNLVYLNLNILNNPRVRQPLYDMLGDKSYATIHYGRNGLNFDGYLDELHNHCFMVCPEGNGIDVHQPWESLYINTIPIQKKNINNMNWRDLPICWLDDWEQLTDETFLISEYKRITTSEFDLSKLDFNFWKNKILNTI